MPRSWAAERTHLMRALGFTLGAQFPSRGPRDTQPDQISGDHLGPVAQLPRRAANDVAVHGGQRSLPGQVELHEVDGHINGEAFAAKALAIFDRWVEAGIIPRGRVGDGASP